MANDEDDHELELEFRPLVEESQPKFQQVRPRNRRIFTVAVLIIVLVAAAAVPLAFYALNHESQATKNSSSSSSISGGGHLEAPSISVVLEAAGRYHLFYQLDRTWAHVASSDLLQWIHLPPSTSSYGSAAVVLTKNDTPVILYSGTAPNGSTTVNAAVPTDPQLLNWTELDANPLFLLGVRGGSPSSAWRGRDGRWRAVLGSSVFAFSDGLSSWEQTATLSSNHKILDFFDVAAAADPVSMRALVVSIGERDFYVLGRFNQSSDEFVVTGGIRLLDHGLLHDSRSFYDDRKGRRVVLAAVHGVLCSPRRIWLDQTSGELLQWPIEEVELQRTRKGSIHATNVSLASGSLYYGYRGDFQVDVDVTFRAPDMTSQMGIENFDVNATSGDAAELCRASVSGILGPFGLSITGYRRRHEMVTIFFHLGRSRDGLVALVCVRRGSSFEGPPSTSNSISQGAYVRLDEHEDLKLRVVIGAGLVEVFAQGGRLSITSFEILRGRSRIDVFNNGTADVFVRKMDFWNRKEP